jgi:hypothetical protein
MTPALTKTLLICGLLLLIAALTQRHALPAPDRLLKHLLQEPEQLPVPRKPLTTTVGGVTYRIDPLYSYDLHGLVVSRHDSGGWMDYIHREWNDHLNVVDLCVIWGRNAVTGSYRDIDFSSGQFVCYWQTSSQTAYAAFDPSAISNNHLLTDDPRVAKQLRAVRVGDQIRFRGYLAEYSHNHGGQPFQRGTSTVRTDTGNGACETVYVQDIEILRRGGSPWRTLLWVAVALLAIGVIAWFRLPLSAGRT